MLPVAIGKATRLIPLLADQRKSYACTLVLGRSTTTQDAHGETVDRSAVPAQWAALLEAALPSFVGRIAQTPPMYSAAAPPREAALRARARRQDRRAQGAQRHDLRADVAGDRVSDRSTGSGQAAARLRVACSEGTYIRTLCHDIGAAIGIPAHMGALVARRLRTVRALRGAYAR